MHSVCVGIEHLIDGMEVCGAAWVWNLEAAEGKLTGAAFESCENESQCSLARGKPDRRFTFQPDGPRPSSLWLVMREFACNLVQHRYGHAGVKGSKSRGVMAKLRGGGN